MVFTLTLVASKDNLSIGHLAEVETLLQDTGLTLVNKPSWLEKRVAADIFFSDKPNLEQIKSLREFLKNDQIDVFTTPSDQRKKRLLIADMDSTIVTSETLDELADHAGIKDKIVPITERAMRGELDFNAALKERVSLLKDLPVNSLDKTLKDTELTPGAKIFIQTMKKHGATCVLVSGGFTFFTNEIAKQAGFNYNHGNELEIKNEKLTGSVIDPILDKNSKVVFLNKYKDDLSISSKDILAIGDGANDLPMLQTAGLGIGYRPKPILEQTLDNCILHGDLSAALYAQGYKKEEFMI